MKLLAVASRGYPAGRKTAPAWHQTRAALHAFLAPHSLTRPAPCLLAAALLATATIAAPVTARAQFKVQYGGHFYENTAPSITTTYDTASHPLFPETISLTNLNPDQYTLDLTISAASNTNTTNGSYVVGVFGEGITNPSGTTPEPSADGANLNVTNNAALMLTNPQGQGAALNVVSQGAPGNPNDGGNTNDYNAGIGGVVNITNNAAIVVNGAAGDFGSTGPSSAGIWAESLGGTGAGGKSNDTPFGGNGGNAGAVSVTMNAGSSVTLNADGTLTQPAIGIYALSQGGIQGQYLDTEYNEYGAPGIGGAVTVYHAGAIGGGAPYTIGIAAVSVGGSGGILSGGGIPDVPGLSGPGGPVQVTLAGTGSIVLTSGNSIGVLAASVFGSQTEGGADTDGYPAGCWGGGACATVTIDQGATIQVGSAPTVTKATFDIGVAAISAGSESIIQPFSSTTASGTGNGTSGPVTVVNAGSIAAYGELAIGIAALSIGGSGLVTNDAGSGTSQVGSTTTSSAGAPASGAAPVQVTNSGSIATDGASAFGIVAISTGAGGLLGAESNATPNGNGGWSNGVFLGNSNSGSGYNAGAITVTNSGSVTTGDGQGGGRVAIGIVAQSIGGGGGSTGGSGAVALVGDDGGRGGNGGTVTIDNTGTVDTFDDGAIGILAQSIGGGGGNGANAAGIFVAVGGNGGDGGAGGAVNINLSYNGASGQGIATTGYYAMGVLAQSVGGGGGNGGYAYSAGLFIDDSLGGTGGSGGNGGNVTVENTSSTIMTTGQQSLGILAQSIGGGGGSGGAATSYSAGAVLSIALAVGGAGGDGGSGGAVSLYNGYGVITQGPDAIGIVEQSIGGGGGNGGASTAKTLAVGIPDTPIDISFAASIGGSGGSGGGGGSVSLVDSGHIVTQGDGAHGILLQSIGGGGGNGGDSTAGAYAIESAAPTVEIGLALGATGGAGGSGGAVTATLGASQDCGGCYTQTETGGHNAAGILAQSIGGGGGNSTLGEASNGAPNLGNDTGDSFSLTVGLGAKGGAGGDGGTVDVTIASGFSNVGAGQGINGSAYDYNLIATRNAGSPGILAQSIGGGGGAAEGGTMGASQNTVSLNLAIGGSAGAGSNGGQVTVDSGAFITTQRGDSIGILAQSIGGGGGVAGSTDASAAINAQGQIQNSINVPSEAYSGNLVVGGDGGSGGSGNAVTVDSTGEIITRGERAYGIEAQSIGGGGGNGGSATSTSNKSTNLTFSATIALAGSGGAGGNGLGVYVTDAAPIVTTGYNAHGVVAQSIGGGGGVGGDGSIDADTTLGIGGGANGNGGTSGSGGYVGVTLNGPSGSILPIGGTVQPVEGAVLTLGDDAFGILAQSIGGGGGTATAGCTNSGAGAISVSALGIANVAPTACFTNTQTLSSNNGPATFLPSADFSMVVGGTASAAGNGSEVNITVDAPVRTIGARAMGVVAQSIGGGGGLTIGSSQTISGTTVAGDPGSNNGTGGTVAVTLGATGSITTSGAGAWGILAQSIGGGGGFAGDPSLPFATPSSNTLPNTARGGANGGEISLTIDGDITTTGTNAHAIFAQSIGGSGGIVAGCCNSPTSYLIAGNTAAIRGISNATYYGNGGNIFITQGAGSTIEAAGSGSIGIVAQSSGNVASTGGIVLTIGGAVIGGTNTGVTEGVGAAGILLSGGSTNSTFSNTITVDAGGAVATVDGVAGTAILANSGYTNVTNAGTITGSIDLGNAIGAITNNGVLNTGASVVTGLLTNNGTLSVHGGGAIGTTTIYGGYTQTSTGKLLIDVNAANPQQTDLLAVTGTAQIAGEIVPTAVSLLPGTATIVTAGNLSSTATVTDPLLFHWSVVTGGTYISLAPQANFTPADVALTSSQASLAQYLTRAWNNGDAFFANRFAYLSQIQSSSQYAALLGASSPRAALTQSTFLANLGSTLLGSAMSCPVFVDQGTLLGEDSCVWMKTSGQWDSQYANNGDPGYNVSSATYRIGAQKGIAPDWFLGASLAYGSTWATEPGGSAGHGQIYDGSVALKHTDGPWLFAGSLSFAGGTFNNDRMVNLAPSGSMPGVDTTLHSNSSLFLAAGRLRAAYDVTLGDLYLRPYGDLDVIYTETPSFSESGRAGYGLDVRSSSQTNVVLSPMVEFGGRYDFRSAITMRPYLAVGASFRPDSTRSVDASFLGDASSDGTFRTDIKSPDMLGNLDVGLQMYRVDGFEIKTEYILRAGDAYLSQSAVGRVAWHF